MRAYGRGTLGCMKSKQKPGNRCMVWIALAAALTLGGCTDVGGPPNNGGSGGDAGSGGMAGMGGTSGMGGMAGAGGGSNTPPEASIVDPASDSGTSNPDLVYDGFDIGLQLWYTDVTVEGLGQDAEDGILTGALLVWKTNRTDIQPEMLGTGENPTIRLYSDDCFGVEHEVTLEATDSNGQTTTSEPRKLFIWTVC
jgi:hypothetical protein